MISPHRIHLCMCFCQCMRVPMRQKNTAIRSSQLPIFPFLNIVGYIQPSLLLLSHLPLHILSVAIIDRMQSICRSARRMRTIGAPMLLYLLVELQLYLSIKVVTTNNRVPLHVLLEPWSKCFNMLDRDFVIYLHLRLPKHNDVLCICCLLHC